MESQDLPGNIYDRLVNGKGLVLDVERAGGPMGSATWRLTNGIVDVEIRSDRGLMGAGVGLHRGATFAVAVWAKVLGVGIANPSIDGQVDFFADNLEAITQRVQAEPEVEARLRDVNWTMAKDRLNLSPEANRDNPESWLG